MFSWPLMHLLHLAEGSGWVTTRSAPNHFYPITHLAAVGFNREENSFLYTISL